MIDYLFKVESFKKNKALFDKIVIISDRIVIIPRPMVK